MISSFADKKSQKKKFRYNVVVFLVRGPIQIIRDTLGGGAGQYHKIPQGDGREFAKVSRDIFSKIFSYILVVLLVLEGKFKFHCKCYITWEGRLRVWSIVTKCQMGEGDLKSVKKVSRIICMALSNVYASCGLELRPTVNAVQKKHVG
jgi:hypothetical protein